MTTPDTCPCSSGLPLADCCGRYHAGELAPTPEALMRSRFAAFALGVDDYVLSTWHPDTRPDSLPRDEATRWVRLEVLDSQAQGDEGQVHFRATFRAGRRWGVMEEVSRFVRLGGEWYYLNGSPSTRRLKPGRNDPCPCGSARKFKACCGRGA